MAKPVIQDTLWAGTEVSLAAHLQQLEVAEDRMAAGVMQEVEPLPRLLSVNDGIGIVSIKGPLSNKDSFMSYLMGSSTYPAIREALLSAATNPEIKHILLDVDSGGGSVAGVSDVASLISKINAKVKPVSTFTDGAMMSAAYWLGSSAGQVYASKGASVGSIGVIATHMEQSQALKNEGIGVTVMRAGKYKALANSVEPLTKDAKDQIQASLDAAYEVFVDHVAEARGVSYEVADKRMAQGQEFFGQGAKDAGLVDAIESFDNLMSKLSADIIDKKTHMPQNRANFASITGISGSTEVIMGREALTEQQIAALAESAGEAASVATPEVEAAAAAAPAPAAEVPAAASGNDQLVSYLQAQVKEHSEAAVKLKVDLASAQEKLAAAEAVVGDLVSIAAKSLNNMQVALGGSALDMSASNPVAVITEHKRVSAQFLETFQAGGVAAVDAAQETPKPALLDPFHMARVKAARFQPK
jgi:signal peptide peptidase SppA